MNKRYIIYISLATLILIIIFFMLLNDDKESPIAYPESKSVTSTISSTPNDYVGRQACVPCHQKEYNLWKNSDHDLAMQIASDTTVLGDFENATFTWYGVTSRFFIEDDIYYVNTEGEDGKNHDYKITYTFGVRPLQQYLVKFPDGRLQTLPLCWDTRPKEQGGQRWYHIYPDERIPPNDILFWTRMNQTWNYMCAECHSTNVKKNYDYQTDSYHTTFSEIDVSCEMCHGPGRAHVKWAEIQEKENRISAEGNMGLKVRLKDLSGGTWVFRDMEKGTAERTVPSSTRAQIETCALCHSRRSQLTDDFVHGKSILNTHRLPFIDERLYFPDGQILEEVYVYHSFLQSKMFEKGVVCSDCHEPHSAKVFSDDNSLCFRCHLPQKFDVPAHHFHKPDSTGGSCRDCHMPERTYMVVDPRRDHSIRIPRPDLSEKLGTPNACIQCHKDKNNRWATDYMVKWYGKKFLEREHFGEIVLAAQTGETGAAAVLLILIRDEEQPDMVKATALNLLQRFPGQMAYETIGVKLYDKDPLIRLAAISALENYNVNEKFTLAKNLLQDPVKSVRIQAAYILSDVPLQSMTAFDRASLNEALEEYIQVQKFNSDRPSALVNLGVVYTRQGKLKEAEEVYKRAIALEPAYVYTYINLSDLYRQTKQDVKGEVLLREAIRRNSGSADLYHSYGLVLTRLKKRGEALAAIQKAAELEPNNIERKYYWALAVLQTGNHDKAIQILEDAYKLDPNNIDILYGLATICRDRGDMRKALKYGRQLVDLSPDNPSYSQLLQEIRGKANQ